jgi:phenylalanine-4-hydroxylase
MVNQYFEIHHYQPLLFVVESFSHLFGMVDQLEQWLQQGRLDNVAPGEPLVNPHDLESFLQAKVDEFTP